MLQNESKKSLPLNEEFCNTSAKHTYTKYTKKYMPLIELDFRKIFPLCLSL